MIKYTLCQSLFCYVLLRNSTKICKIAWINFVIAFILDFRIVFTKIKSIKLLKFTFGSSLCDVRLVKDSNLSITLSLLLLIQKESFLVFFVCILTWVSLYVLLRQNFVIVSFEIQKSCWSDVRLAVRDVEGISVFPTRIVLNNYS